MTLPLSLLALWLSPNSFLHDLFRPHPAGELVATPSPVVVGDRPEFGAVKLALAPLVEGLQMPTDAVALPDGRLLVAQLNGKILVVGSDGGTPTEIADLLPLISTAPEHGLLAIALHPTYDGTSEDRLFGYWVAKDGIATVLGVLHIGDASATSAAPIELLRIDRPISRHNGGDVVFLPDGSLVLSSGDAREDENLALSTAQDPTSRLGKLLRFQVERDDRLMTPGDSLYPEDPAIRAIGLRNPWRLDVDPASGDLWIGDPGSKRYEEVSVIRVGTSRANLGWNRIEGNECVPYGSACEFPKDYLPPAFAYDRKSLDFTGACSVIGGVVYRGSAIPALRGAYLFTDWCRWRLMGLDAAVPEEPVELLDHTGHMAAGFARDAEGEVLLIDTVGGAILRLVAAD